MIKAAPLKTSDDSLQISFKEIADYQYVPEEFSTATIRVQKVINRYPNENFCTIPEFSSEELIGQNCCTINLGYYLKPIPHACERDQTKN